MENAATRLVAKVRDEIAIRFAPYDSRMDALEARLKAVEGRNLERGQKGEDGLSAFDLWRAAGNSGTLGDFFESLKGAQGEVGAVGAMGPQGEIGPKGEPGLDGSIGEKGATGKTGKQGPQGEVGPVGEVGEKGEPGERGPVGEAGPKGDIGEKGEQGEKGLKGEKGDTGPEGSIGPKGKVGERGHKGEKGDRGEMGPAGPRGLGIKSSVINEDGELILKYENDETANIGRIVGRDGLGMDSLEVDFDGERELSFVFGAGEQKYIKRVTIPVPIYRGVWKEGIYEKGDMVTFGGSVFVAHRDTGEKPESCDDWQLSVKKGRNGRDLRDG